MIVFIGECSTNLSLNIFNEKHIFATYARTKEHFMSLLAPCR